MWFSKSKPTQPATPSASGQRTLEFMARPFTRDDLQPLPEGWTIRPPDFVGVASGKAGTTWWYSLLLAHPQIKPNRLGLKETGYWYNFGCQPPTDDQVEVYRQAFAAPQNCLCGEWSPGYLTHPLVIEKIAVAAPDAKLLAILRNPIDRFWSGYNQMLSLRFPHMNLDGLRAELFKIHSLFPAAARESLVARDIKRLRELFDENVLILQYEKCKLDPARELARSYAFLGVDPSFRPPHLTAPVHAKPHTLPPLTGEQREWLSDYFSDDVIELSYLVPGFDRSLWKDF
jgi:hypothetical protein